MPARPHRSVTCLGVGDGFADVARGHAAFLYRFADTRLLVDCGEPATRALLRSGMDLQELDRVFVSHLHFDHVGGLFTLLQSLWLARRERPLTIHLPGAGIRPIQALMRTALLFDDWQAFPLHFEPLRAWVPVLAGTTTVTPVPSTHLRALGMRRGKAAARLSEAFSFILEDGRCRVAHSADVGGLEDVSTLVRDPLDLLVCELAHVEPVALLAALRGRPIRQLALVHLSADRWRQRRRWLARASGVLAPIRVQIPEDGARLRF
jgi:phosphoribosyl 1,2-cyclic phosphodiesterase